MRKLKSKFKAWLFKDEIALFTECITQAKKDYMEAQSAYIAAQHEFNESRELINSMMDVGVDVCYYEQSWAVVCVQGHPEYVKFMPLSSNDARSLLEFLKRFRKSNVVVDAPMGFRRILDDSMILKNPLKN